MHGFKERVVTIPNDPGIEFEDCSFPQVVDPVLRVPLIDFGNCVSEHQAKMPGALSCLSSVFGEVLQNRPEVQERSPINVAQIGQEQMRFEVVEQRVTSCEEEIS